MKQFIYNLAFTFFVGFFVGRMVQLYIFNPYFENKKPEPEQVTVFVCTKCGEVICKPFEVYGWYTAMPPTNIFDSARMNDQKAWE